MFSGFTTAGMITELYCVCMTVSKNFGKFSALFSVAKIFTAGRLIRSRDKQSPIIVAATSQDYKSSVSVENNLGMAAKVKSVVITASYGDIVVLSKNYFADACSLCPF